MTEFRFAGALSFTAGAKQSNLAIVSRLEDAQQAFQSYHNISVLCVAVPHAFVAANFAQAHEFFIDVAEGNILSRRKP